MSWRFLFATLLVALGASAWGGIQLGDWLVAHEVPAERVFLLPPRVGEDEKSAGEQKAKASRVDFSLK